LIAQVDRLGSSIGRLLSLVFLIVIVLF